MTSLSLLAGAEYRAVQREIQERRSTECRFRRTSFVLLNEGRDCASAKSDERRERMAGQMVHVEFPAGNTAKASEFWGSLFGWNFESYPGPSEYLMTRFSDNQGGAIYGAEGDERGARVYFDVDDINTGIARVKELGGEAGEGMAVPSMGWFATCTDTEGNKFGLWQTDPNAPNPGA
jgi:uncharacterized protein